MAVARIPVPLTSLLGRDDELARLLTALEEPGVRLVTVTGPGGTGKTRLAVEAAMITAGRVPGYFVSLSSMDSPSQVLPAIAAALHVVDTDTDTLAAVAQRFFGAETILLLDTFEHVIAAAPDVAELLSVCPRLKVLATSRAPLRIRGELEFPLGPLSLEPVGGGVSAAAALFIERAAAVAPGAAVDAEVVADICARLEGLPLAIELAAARLRHIPATHLRRHLDHRLDPLAGGARDMPDRHRTLRSTFDWSYALLGGPEMRLFRALAVFRDGFERGAALAVAGIDDEKAPGALDNLVDSSLVTLVASEETARYRLLDVGREYALERATTAGEVEGLCHRHALYFLGLAERLEPQLRGEGQVEAFEALSREDANLRAAIHWALAESDAETALRLGAALWMYWRWTGLFTEGRALLDAALEAGANAGVEIRCQAMWGAGWLAFHAGDFERTESLGNEMLTLLRPRRDGVLVRNALTLVGNAALGRDRSSDAVAALTGALHACQSVGRGWHLATSELNLGTALLGDGEIVEAGRHLDAALEIYRDLGDRHFTARALAQLGYLRLVTGDISAARKPIGEAMEIFAGLADSWALAEGFEAVAAASAEASPAAAVQLVAAAGRIRQDIGMRAHPPDERTVARRVAVAREALGREGYERAWRQGAELETAAACALALRAV